MDHESYVIMLLVKDELIKRLESKFGKSKDDPDSWKNVTSSDIPVAPDVSSEVAISRIRGLRILVLGNHGDHVKSMSEALHGMRVRVMTGRVDESGYRTALKFRPDVIVRSSSARVRSDGGSFRDSGGIRPSSGRRCSS